MSLYERVRGGGGRGWFGFGSGASASSSATDSNFEVVLVSWDENEADRLAYARGAGMKWLSLPQGPLVDECTLRYGVAAIPTLVVIEVSEDGTEARLITRDGRMDLERGQAPWLTRVLAGR